MADEAVKMPTKTDWLAQQAVKGHKTPAEGQQPWSLWEEAISLDGALNRTIAHCQQMRADIQRGLSELERMLGSMPKR